MFLNFKSKKNTFLVYFNRPNVFFKSLASFFLINRSSGGVQPTFHNMYRMSHRYWANFSTSYLWLEPIVLGPDSIPMTHSSSKASMIGIEIRFKTFIKQNTKYDGFFLKVLYSGTWVHKQVWVKFKVPEYGSRFPSTGPILGIYLGPGSRVRVQVPEYGFWKK